MQETDTPDHTVHCMHGGTGIAKKKRPTKASLDRNTKASLRWLHEMALFYQELSVFLTLLPKDLDPEKISTITPQLQADPRFQTLCKVSQNCAYRRDIPIESCRSAVETVQDLSREIFLQFHSHPVLRMLPPWKESRPFFERAMLVGSCLAVEHDIRVDQATAQSRRAQRGVQKIVSLLSRSKKETYASSPGSLLTECPSDDEMTFICEQFGMDGSTCEAERGVQEAAS